MKQTCYFSVPTALLLVVAVLLAAPISAQDTVVVLGKDGRSTSQRKGRIVDFTGVELRLQTAVGKEETIPTARVGDVSTTWTPAYQRALQLRAEGKSNDAAAAFRQARQEDERPWARRKIMAQLTGCWLDLGRVDAAGDEFLAIVASDPNTQYYNLYPLAWRSLAPDAALEARADVWLRKERHPAAMLLGASWLLASEQRSAAITVLEKLSIPSAANADARLTFLAEVQLWRTKIVTAKMDDIARWQRATEKAPAEIRGVAYYQIAEALARNDQPEQAALAFLKIPLLDGAQRWLAADALLAAGGQLERLSRPAQAVGLYRELATDYATTPVAAEALARLEKMTKE